MTLKRAFFAAAVFLLGAIAAAGTIYLLSGTGDQFAEDRVGHLAPSTYGPAVCCLWEDGAWWAFEVGPLLDTGDQFAYDAENL